MTFHECCENIAKYSNSDYAKSYAQQGLAFFDAERQEAQIQYLLSNISHWRGPLAKEVRAELKRMAKEGVA